MAIVSCSACQKKLKVADTSVGKKVKCSCGNIFVAEADSSAVMATPVMAVEAPDKVIVACTECGSKLKVATASVGKKLKCPKCAAVFVANIDMAAASPPVMAAPVVASAVVVPADEDDDFAAFARAESKDEDGAKPKKGKAPPPMVDDDDDAPWTPKAKGKPEPKRPVPTNADAPKKYPSRILVNCFVFFMLFGFLAFFAGVFLFMDEENLLDPTSALEPTNRKVLEGFGWPEKAAPAKRIAPVPAPGGGKKMNPRTTKPIEAIEENGGVDKGDKGKKNEDGKNIDLEKKDENACLGFPNQENRFAARIERARGAAINAPAGRA